MFAAFVLFGADAADTMDGRFRSFFALAKKNKPEWRDEQFRQIKDVGIYLLRI